MANRPYLQGLYHFANADINYLSDNIKVSLLSASYAPNTAAAADEYYNIIPGGAIVADSANIASKTNTGGVLDAADLVFSSVSGSIATQFVMRKDTGTSSTSPLFFLWDTATNLPVTPNGGNITIQWAGSPNFVGSIARDLSDADRRLVDRMGWRRLVDMIRDLGIPADRKSGGGIWLPTPTIVQG